MNRFLRLRLRNWLYPLISLSVIAGICLGQVAIAKAISWGDLIRQGVQVIQLSSLSDKQEVDFGKQINNELKSQVRISRNPQLTAYINDIGQRLAKNSSRRNIPYTFQVVEDNGVNAFATMGGFVYVNTGLVKLADNEAELASVIGHEIGHIAARHSINQMKEQALASGIANVAGLNRNTAIRIGVDLALRRPHSRRAEYEADELGIKALGQAGYGQSAAPTFMSKLMTQRSTPTFFSTHPPASDRVARLKQAVNPNQASGTGLDSAAYRAKVRSLL
ncbi:MAG TPA: M48 family metallopeptidase [Thermosynechococcaceae cyanobacterium]